MKRLISVFLFLALFVCVCASTAPAAEPAPCFIHMVVIPDTLADGSSTEDLIDTFQKGIISLAGGFTELGPSQGGELVNGEVEYQDNVTFLVGAPTDISAELHKLSLKLFGEPGAFVMAWPGTMTN